MQKTRKVRQHRWACVRILTGICILGAFLFLSSCRIEIDYFSEMANYEWESLSFYTGTPGDYLGVIPDNQLGKVYEMDGAPTNQLLYAEKTWFTGNSVYQELLWNEEFEDPMRCFPIEKVTIRTQESTLIVIEEPQKMRLLSELLKTDGTKLSERYVDKRNTEIEFDLPCRLTLSCRVDQNTEGNLLLTVFNEKTGFCHVYDVTNILGEAD